MRNTDTPLIRDISTRHHWCGMQELEGELQDERKARQVDSKRVLELTCIAERLQQVKESLEQEAAALKSEKAQLVQRTETLVQEQTELRQTSDKLRTDNNALSQQVYGSFCMLAIFVFISAPARVTLHHDCR